MSSGARRDTAATTSVAPSDPWTLRLFETIDAMDAAGFASRFTPDGSFRFGNAEPAIGRVAIEAATRAFFTAIGGLRHRVVGVWTGNWEHGAVRSVETEVRYTRKDGSQTAPLPATSTLRMKGDQIHDFRIFADVSPLFSADGAGDEGGPSMNTVDPSRMLVPATDGTKISFMGMDLIWKVTSAMSRGAYVAFIHVAPPGSGVPMHLHHNDEESLFVIEGRMVVRVADETFDVGPGDVVNMPRGIPHGFRVAGSSPAQVLFTIDLAPTSDYEAMFDALVGVEPDDFERIRAATAANGVEMLDPPVMP